MDEVAVPTAGRVRAADAPVARRLHDLAHRIPPAEIAEFWVFPPLAELEQSSEFFLLTRFQDGERRTLYSARLRTENGNGGRQVVVEHGSVPADRVPRLVQRLRHRLRDGREPVHAVIAGERERWEAFLDLLVRTGETAAEIHGNGGNGGNGAAPAPVL